MDGIAEEATPQPISDADMGQYFTTDPNSSVLSSSWPVADLQYPDNNEASFALFGGPSVWLDEEMGKYIVDNHPMVMDEAELEFALSDNSNTASSDSEGWSSSNTNSATSNPSLLARTQWSNLPISYDSPNRDSPFPSACFEEPSQSVYRPITVAQPSPFLSRTGSLFFPSIELASHTQTVNPLNTSTAFIDALSHERLPRGGLSHSAFPMSSRASPFRSNGDEPRYIALSDLSAPYVPDQRSYSTDLGILSSSDDLPLNSPLHPSSSGLPSTPRGAQSTGPSAQRLSSSVNVSPKRWRPPLSSTSAESEESIPMSKRLRPEDTSEGYTARMIDDEEGESDADDDDVYMPSRSPSHEPSPSEYSESNSPPMSLLASTRIKKGKNKAGATMSAADALAQISATSSKYATSEEVDDDGDSGSSGAVRYGKSRRNRIIPLPIPVPHLIKKSRGRKVPYVDARAARGVKVEHDEDSVEGSVRGIQSSKGRGGARGKSGGRSFVCSVAGCGKCFVRGEHLKRHVRSIHTHEKPFRCPYAGCEKAFSRRDNLGQHVRLHLSGSLD